MMRSTTGRFTILSILLIISGNILISGFTGNSHRGRNNSTTHNSINDFFQDTLPIFKVKEKQAPSGENEKFFKRLLNVFKFKKNAEKKEKDRVIALLNKVNIVDSIAATKQNVDTLIKYLKDQANKKNIDSLVAKIIEIKFKQLKLDSAAKVNTQKQARYAPQKVSDADLTILANQISQIIELSPDIEAASVKTDRIIALQNIRDSSSIKRKRTDSLYREYLVTLKNKIEVYGFYDYSTGDSVQTDKLGYLNTFIYNSLFIHSKTGEIKDISGWNDADIITTAQNAGCDAGVTFAFEKPHEADSFLNNKSSQATFIKKAIEIMKFRLGKAINISFKNIANGSNSNFYYFIKALYKSLKRDTSASYKLLLTIPATTSGNYPLSLLPSISDRIIIDFSENYALKASPLASLRGLNDSLANFLAANIPKNKIVVSLPYRGTIWYAKNGKRLEFIDYIKYKTLRDPHLFAGYVNYLEDSLGSFVVMDSFRIVKKDTSLLRRIYYDDVSTISSKYEFILKNEFAGVAVNGLGDDFGYTGLWDEMSYAFARPDTVYTASGEQVKPAKDLSFFDKKLELLKLYYYILENPCVTCFDNIREKEKREELKQYLADLDIHKEMFEKNKEFREKNMDTWRSAFNYLSDQLTSLLKTLNIIIFLILLCVGAFYVYKVINIGDSWSLRKPTGFTIIGLSILFVLLLFTWLFSNDLIPFFGYRSSYNEGYSGDYINYLISNSGNDKDMKAFLQELNIDPQNPGIKNLNVGYCDPDPQSRCINMPLTKLLGIIILVLTMGYFLTRNVIMPMMKKDELP